MRRHCLPAAALLLAWLRQILAQSPPEIARDYPGCPGGITSVEVQPVEIVWRQPTRISAFISSDTLIVLDETRSINVTNAPLTLVTEIVNYVTSITLITRYDADFSCKAQFC
jgi:hypothetical protein